MSSIRAISFAPDVIHWLAHTHHPRILHVFDRACNLINEQGEVLSIVTGEIGNGPFNVVVEDWVVSAENLQLESSVTILENQLIVVGLTLNTADAICWSPCPDWKRLHDDRDKIADQLAALPILRPQSPKYLYSNLSSALARGDVSSSKAFTSQLAGLGVGLTPAGDDFILGALFATWIIHPPKVAESIATGVANIAAPLTTSLSAAWLRAAGRGEAGELWHEYFNALTFSDPDQVRSTGEKIMSVGSTSGVEALAGFIATSNSYMEIKKKYVIPGSI